MPFRRFLAILLLLILPLQSTLAAIDNCCNGAAGKGLQSSSVAADHTSSDTAALASQPDGDANCCTGCDYCNHFSASFVVQANNLHDQVLSEAPVPHPDFPLESFIPDVPSRPDRG